MATNSKSRPSATDGSYARTSRGTFGPGNRFASGNRGRFRPGNKAAKGNPFAKRVQELRQGIYDEPTYADVRKMVRKLIDMAIRGDVAAAKVILDKLFGKDPASVVQVLRDDRFIVNDVRDEANEDGDYDPKGW
jgi:hypothetical protein